MPLNILILVLFCAITTSCQSQTGKKSIQKNNMNNDKVEIQKTEEEWKKLLTPEQFYVIREKGTERPFTGKFYLHKEKGVYVCGACGNELFTSDMKFDSHCGWPSFDREIAGGRIKTQTDLSHGMVRTEIMCAKCGGHLGHLFNDGPTSTGMRYCVNSLSLDFKKEE
jgi:methionine-R-sulfoxide reductase